MVIRRIYTVDWGLENLAVFQIAPDVCFLFITAIMIFISWNFGFFLWIYPFFSCSWPRSLNFPGIFPGSAGPFSPPLSRAFWTITSWQVASLEMSSLWVRFQSSSSQWPDHWTSYYITNVNQERPIRKTVWFQSWTGAMAWAMINIHGNTT